MSCDFNKTTLVSYDHFMLWHDDAAGSGPSRTASLRRCRLSMFIQMSGVRVATAEPARG